MIDIPTVPSAAKKYLLGGFYGAAVCGSLALVSASSSDGHTDAWVITAGAMLGVAATAAARVGAFIESATLNYSDREYGPPSHITREMFVFGSPDNGIIGRFHGWLSRSSSLMSGVAFALTVVGAWL